MAGKLLLELLMEWKLLLEPWADGEGRAPAQPLGKRTPRQLYVGIIHYSFSFSFSFFLFASIQDVFVCVHYILNC